MLADFPLNPVLPARDRERAEAFYVEKLGLRRMSPPGADPMAFGAGGDTTVVLTVIAGRPGVEGEIAGFITDYGAVKSAFLRDSEGNVLALNEIVAAP
jgi:catechol 2,3-dioxygenase-like lactoylglutathione lyase family enzyme